MVSVTRSASCNQTARWGTMLEKRSSRTALRCLGLCRSAGTVTKANREPNRGMM